MMKNIKRMKVIAAIVLFVCLTGCSKDEKANSDQIIKEKANITEPIKSSITENDDFSNAEAKNIEELPEKRLEHIQGIKKDQVFDVSLDGFGPVTLAAVLPEQKSGKNSDVQFKLFDQEKEVYIFPGRNEDNRLDSDEFIDVLAVAFTDYNKDNKNDILIINEYANTLDDHKHYNEVRVYTQLSDSKEFTQDSLLTEFLMKNYYNENIESVLNGIEEYKEYEKSLDGSQSVDAQIELIVKNMDLWLKDTEFAEGGYYYAVTDLDHNGRLEVIASLICGNGAYSYSDFYEVNDTFDGISLCKTNFMEGDSEADISVDQLVSFTDDSTGDEYYIFDDFMKSGAAEHYENKRAITLKEGEIKEIPLANKSIIYQNETDYEVTCVDSDQKTITEKQYDEIADTVFSDLRKNQVTIGWYETNDNNTLKDMSQVERKKLLENSYDNFTENPMEN